MTSEEVGWSTEISPKWEEVVCPECGARLQERSEVLGCANCRREWRVVNGVPQFLAGSSEGEAIAKEEHPHSSDSLETVNWQWLIDLPAESSALDVGAGVGKISHALALRFQKVIAVEPVLEHVEVIRKRIATHGLSNLKVLRSSPWILPFLPASFDLVVMNGVLDRVVAGQAGPVKAVQARALGSAFNLLRPGGWLYVAVENKLCLESVLRRRQAASLDEQSRAGRRILYSAYGYGKLLRAAGFFDTRCFVATPSYNEPRFLAPLDSNIFSYYIRNFTPPPRDMWRNAARQVLLGLDLLKHCQRSFIFIARKEKSTI